MTVVPRYTAVVLCAYEKCLCNMDPVLAEDMAKALVRMTALASDSSCLDDWM
jgi:hypothetical protein